MHFFKISLALVILFTLSPQEICLASDKREQEIEEHSIPSQSTTALQATTTNTVLPNSLVAGAKEHEEATYLHHLAPELLMHIFQFLPRKEDLCHVGATSKAFKSMSEDTTLWWPHYSKVKLVPYADTSTIPDPHVTSYKHLWITIKLLQAALNQGAEPDYDQLSHSISQAFAGKIILYEFQSKIYALKKEPEKAQHYRDQFNLGCLTQAGYNSAIFWGHYGLESITEDKRLNYLRSREKKGDQDAQRWVDQALFQGQLGQAHRPFSERLTELKERIEAGDQNALITMILRITQSKGLDQEYGSPAECFADLEHYSKLGDTQAQSALVQAIYDGSFNQDTRPKEERFQDLKRRAAAGDISAQSYVVQALVRGTLGQEERDKQERFNELLSLDYEDAHKQVLYALSQGDLGQDSKPVQERLQQIETLMLQWKSQRNYYPHLIYMILEGKGLGQEDRTASERFAHLERLAEAGIEAAERELIQAIYDGKLGQDSRTKTERFEDLKQRAQKGSFAAVGKVIEALYNGRLAQKQRSADERYHDLKSYAEMGNLEAQKLLPKIIERGGFSNSINAFESMLCKKELSNKGSKLSDGLLWSLKQELARQGNIEAQKWLNQALYEGTYGQDALLPSARFAELHKQARAGDKDAEERVVKALSSRELGQMHRPLQDLFADLDFWARRGNLTAQQKIVEAIAQGYFEQDLIPATERVNDLRRRGEQGNAYAFNTLVDLLLSGGLEQYRTSPQVRYEEIDNLSKRGNNKAEQAITKLLTTGVIGFCYEENGINHKVEFLGQDQKLKSERFEALKKHAAAGNDFARAAVINAIHQETLGQTKEQKIKNLLAWAALGDRDAQQFMSWDYAKNRELQSYSDNLGALYELLTLLASPASALRHY
jgi:hypothetical protein